MNYFEEAKQILHQYKHLGEETISTGTVLIGRVPHNGPKAWLHYLFAPLSNVDINTLEEMMKLTIPLPYKEFLLNFGNGINIFSNILSLDGLRKILGRTTIEASAQPFSIDTPNVFERPKNAKKEYFFIGGYSWDGSLLYINSLNNRVYLCSATNAKPLIEWNSFEEMLLSEVQRIHKLFDKDGRIINEKIATTPKVNKIAKH